jgi:hypothetical protein
MAEFPHARERGGRRRATRPSRHAIVFEGNPNHAENRKAALQQEALPRSRVLQESYHSSNLIRSGKKRNVVLTTEGTGCSLPCHFGNDAKPSQQFDC